MASRKGWNNKEDGWVKTFHVEVDDRTNAIFTLIYDWGAWCHCVIRCDLLPIARAPR